MARPHKEINWDVVEKLIDCGCPGTEIAAKFRIQADTFYRRFKEEYEVSFQDYRVPACEAGLADLRAMIHAKAINNKAPGNSNLLIFLAKVKLGYKEPEGSTTTAPKQAELDASYQNMELQHKLTEMQGLLEQYGQKFE